MRPVSISARSASCRERCKGEQHVAHDRAPPKRRRPLLGRLRSALSRERHGGFSRSADQCDRRRHPAGRVLRRGDGRDHDHLRHARHRQYRAAGLHPARFLCGVHRQRGDRARSDPDRRLDAAGLLRDRHDRLSALLPCVRIARRAVDPGSRLLFRSAVRRRSVADPGLRRRLPLCRSALYRPEPAVRHFRPAAADADPVRGVAGHGRRAAALPDAQLYRTRDPGGIAGRAGAAADGGGPDPDQADRVRHFDRDLRAWPALF